MWSCSGGTSTPAGARVHTFRSRAASTRGRSGWEVSASCEIGHAPPPGEFAMVTVFSPDTVYARLPGRYRVILPGAPLADAGDHVAHVDVYVASKKRRFREWFTVAGEVRIIRASPGLITGTLTATAENRPTGEGPPGV